MPQDLAPGGATLINGSAFDAASWTKTRSSVVANATVDPLGTSLADSLVEDATAGATHFAQEGFWQFIASQPATVSIYAKAGTRSWIYLGDAAGPNSTNPGVYFDLTNGVQGTLTGTGASASITPAGNGWYLCTLTGVNPNATFHVRLATADGTSSYNGNGTGNVYLFGASVTQIATPPASRIIRMSAKRDGLVAMGLPMLRLLGARDGTSLVVQIWFYDDSQAAWVRHDAPVTLTSATSNATNKTLGNTAGAKYFVQVVTNTGGVSAFAYDIM